MEAEATLKPNVDNDDTTYVDMHNDATLPLFFCGRDDTGLSLQVFHINTNDINNHFLT